MMYLCLILCHNLVRTSTGSDWKRAKSALEIQASSTFGLGFPSGRLYVHLPNFCQSSMSSPDSDAQRLWNVFSLNIFVLARLWRKLAAYFNHSSPLPGTKQYWWRMEKHGRDPGGARTHDPWDERQTLLPLVHRAT